MKSEATVDILSQTIAWSQEHRVCFTRGAFEPDNPALEAFLNPFDAGERPLALVFWDGGLEAAFPALSGAMESWFASRPHLARLAAAPIRLPGGEGAKNDFRLLERVWTEIESAKLCRHSYVVAVGGGAILDLVGFCAATAHRGIPLVRLPTTSLSQADGGLGVKNGVNRFRQKNWLGTFGVPHAVVNDFAFLDGLPPRERRAGLIEAVKVGLIRDGAFFEWIEREVHALAAFEREPFEAVIRESARQHLEHIACSGDPFERGSARPLDFGHWAAHKLEQISGFTVPHGEAVAVGMALDLIYARRLGLLPPAEEARIIAVIAGLGFPLFHPAVAGRAARGRRALLEGLEEFRQHLGGRLTIPMIRAPGERVDVHEMDTEVVDAAIDELASRHG